MPEGAPSPPACRTSLAVSGRSPATGPIRHPVAIAVVSTMSGEDYRTFNPVFPVGDAREEFDELVDDLSVIDDAIVDDISLDAVVGSIFGEESD